MTLFEFLTWESFAQRFQYNLSVTLWVVISSPIPLIWQVVHVGPRFPRLPGIRCGISLPTVAFGIEDVAVFAVIENLNVWMIRTKVT